MNITQNAQADNVFNRFGNDAQNARDAKAYKDAFNILRNNNASKEEKANATAIIKRIQERRKEEMVSLVTELLDGRDDIILETVGEGTGVYDSDNGVITEYTSEVKLKVKRGKEQEAKQLMAVLAEALKQDAYIMAGENAIIERTKYLKLDEKTKESYYPTVQYEADHVFTPEEVAELSKKLSEEHLGCTIIGNKFESTNYGEKSEKEFRQIVKEIITEKYGNAKTEASDSRKDQKGSGRPGTAKNDSGKSGGVGIKNRYKSTEYISARNENDKFIDKDGKETKTERYYGDIYLGGQRMEGNDVSVQEKGLTNADKLLQRMKNVVNNKEKKVIDPAEAQKKLEPKQRKKTIHERIDEHFSKQDQQTVTDMMGHMFVDKLDDFYGRCMQRYVRLRNRYEEDSINGSWKSLSRSITIDMLTKAEAQPSFAFAQVRLRLSNVKIYFPLHSACTYFA